MLSIILQNTGFGNIHNILDVNPFVLLETSSMIGSADCGWVKPKSVNEVRCILKLALPVTINENKTKNNDLLLDKEELKYFL
jgi:hypothetical protein